MIIARIGLPRIAGDSVRYSAPDRAGRRRRAQFNSGSHISLPCSRPAACSAAPPPARLSRASLLRIYTTRRCNPLGPRRRGHIAGSSRFRQESRKAARESKALNKLCLQPGQDTFRPPRVLPPCRRDEARRQRSRVDARASCPGPACGRFSRPSQGTPWPPRHRQARHASALQSWSGRGPSPPDARPAPDLPVLSRPQLPSATALSLFRRPLRIFHHSAITGIVTLGQPR